MRIVGIDVCKASIVCCLITERPAEPRQFYFDARFHTLQADAAGINYLLAMQPDVAVMEPTGVNYARLWGTHLARAGVKVALVGHTQLRGYRRDHLGLPDKDDAADALALACYYFDYHGSDRRFVQIRDRTIARVRQLVLRLCHLNRVQSPIMNRCRQDLAWQFPEAAMIRSKRSENQDTPLFWGWLAGERTSKKYDQMLVNSCGLGLSETVNLHARRICDLQREEAAIERELRELMAAPEFEVYREVFREFGFGERVSALILSQIYPFENFLDADGRPDVKIRRGRNSGKPTKRHLSLRRFQKSLGVAPTLEASGDMSRSKVVGGSDLCRKALWQWIYTRIEPTRTRMKNEIGKQLGDRIDTEKASGRPVRLVRSRLAAIAAKLLFRELVRRF